MSASQDDRRGCASARPTQPATLFMPSVSVMMESVLKVYGRHDRRADDGNRRRWRRPDGGHQQAGGDTIAESEETAVVYGMPREAAERGGAVVVAPSYEVAGEIVKAVRRTMP